jgi:multidrug resistance protein
MAETKISKDLTTSPEPYTIFTTPQKALIITIVSLAATLSGFASNIYFPALPQVANDLSVSSKLVNLTVTLYLIFQGLSPTIWGALADTRGRRVTYCSTLIIFLGACIGLAETRSYAQLLILRCVQSTGSASTIALGSGVIGDVTKKEERGSYMGLFQGGLLMPVAIGPVIGGVLAQNLGWRSVFWFLTIYGGFCLLLIIITLPETLRSMVGNGSIFPPRYARSVLSVYKTRSLHREATPRSSSEETKVTPKQIDFLGPLRILFGVKTFCAILFVAIHYAIWQMILTALSSLVSKMYGLNEIKIGLIFLANGAGSMTGTVLVGRFLDYEYKKALAKHSGDAELLSPEGTRLRTIWIWSVVEAASVLAFGWTVDQHVHISIPIIAFFFLGWAAISLQSMVATYLVDVHHTRSASASASLNLVRCLLGAAGTAVIGPLLDAIHAGWTFTLLAGLMLMLGGAALFMVFRGAEQQVSTTDSPA